MSYHGNKRSRHGYEEHDDVPDDYDGEELKFVKILSPAEKKRLNILKTIQTEHEKLEVKRDKEIAEIDAKYQSLYEPLYAKRFNAINGCKQPKKKGSTTTSSANLKLPKFWLTAMKNNDFLAKEIKKHDEQALAFLQDIKYFALIDVDHPKITSFRLDFVFDAAKNPYFKNPVLSKEFHLKLDSQGKPVKDLTLGTKIEWIQPLSNACYFETFFNFFGPLRRQEVNPEEDKLKTEEENNTIISSFNHFNMAGCWPDDSGASGDEDGYFEEPVKAVEICRLSSDDYEVAVTIRDKIIPRAVLWYTGKAAKDEKKDYNSEDEYGCSGCRWH